MAKLAFLTEVRDGEAYLAQAVESVLAQTWGDFDYYITDDGSQDGTREIIARYAAQDSRIIPIYCENDMHGNFNRTLERIYASGADYFALLDGDDWYEPRFAETLITTLEETGADLAEAKFTAHYEDESGEDELPGFGDCVVTLRDFAERFAFFSYFDGVQQWWGKIYRVALLRQAGLLADAGWDTAFVLRYRALCRSFAFRDEALHHYRIRPDSDCHKRILSFDGRRVALALALQHGAREDLLAAAGCKTPESRLMCAYQDVNGVKSNLMRIHGGHVPEAVAAAEVPRLFRLPFLAPAYEAVERAYAETGRLFFAGPEDSRRAMESLRSYYGRFLRLIGVYAPAGNEALLFGWLCRVFPRLADFFEPEDLAALLSEEAIPLLEGRYAQAGALLRRIGPADGLVALRAFVCAQQPDGGAFLRQYTAGALTAKKRRFLRLQTGV